ncbi:MAG TPA: hypothetical protein VK446_09900 [Methylocystis sp.]|nr:hypothetical protein [Methylocystis sp.]
MQAIHIICHAEGSGHQNLWRLDDPALYRSACWPFPNFRDLQPLIGGWIYLHELKSEPSYLGGVIQKIESCERHEARIENGYAFIFRADDAAKNRPWRGQAHDRAWTGGLVQANFEHEKTQHARRP